MRLTWALWWAAARRLAPYGKHDQIVHADTGLKAVICHAKRHETRLKWPRHFNIGRAIYVWPVMSGPVGDLP